LIIYYINYAFIICFQISCNNLQLRYLGLKLPKWAERNSAIPVIAEFTHGPDFSTHKINKKILLSIWNSFRFQHSKQIFKILDTSTTNDWCVTPTTFFKKLSMLAR